MDMRDHWETVYAEREPEQVSWYRPHLEQSLALIEGIADRDARVIDVGGGASTLAEDLLARGYERVTVLDVAEKALARNRERMGVAAERVTWIAGDVRSVELPVAAFDVWHDRAVCHFLTEAADRAAYVGQAARAVKPGGHVVVSTFGLAGPIRCSGLDVVRYDAEGLAALFGEAFALVESAAEVHRTPWGAEQAFVAGVLRRL